MSEIVPTDQIEQIVGCRRHATAHIGRAVSGEETVYILHSQQCKDSTPDLRGCVFSTALDRGIQHPVPWALWENVQDQPVRLKLHFGYLVPYTGGES